jgi:hypothetical protein
MWLSQPTFLTTRIDELTAIDQSRLKPPVKLESYDKTF